MGTWPRADKDWGTSLSRQDPDPDKRPKMDLWMKKELQNEYTVTFKCIRRSQWNYVCYSSVSSYYHLFSVGSFPLPVFLDDLKQVACFLWRALCESGTKCNRQPSCTIVELHIQYIHSHHIFNSENVSRLFEMRALNDPATKTK